MRLWTVLLVVAACGRVGFERTAGDVTGSDALPDMASADVAPDGVIVLTGMGCAQPPPFIWISSLDVTQFTVTAVWCSAGLSGIVDATLESATGTVMSMQVDVATNTVTLADIVCGGCFVRLEIGGYRYDSEPFDLIGD